MLLQRSLATHLDFFFHFFLHLLKWLSLSEPRTGCPYYSPEHVDDHVRFITAIEKINPLNCICFGRSFESLQILNLWNKMIFQIFLWMNGCVIYCICTMVISSWWRLNACQWTNTSTDGILWYIIYQLLKIHVKNTWGNLCLMLFTKKKKTTGNWDSENKSQRKYISCHYLQTFFKPKNHLFSLNMKRVL